MIDILLATYNGGAHLSEQLDSLVSQDFKDFRVVIHDDGSSDNTLEVIRSYVRMYPELFIFINDGLVFGKARDNFAHLIGLSSAKYVMFCDQDDVWLPSKVRLSIDALQKIENGQSSTPCFAFTDLCVVDERLDVISSSMVRFQRINTSPSKDSLLYRNSVTGCTLIVNRAGLETAGSVYSRAVMHDWWIALSCLCGGGRYVFLSEATILYRQHGSNSVGAQRFSLKDVFRRVWKLEYLISLIAIYKQARAFRHISFPSFIWRKLVASYKAASG